MEFRSRNWLTKELEQKIKKVFESRYERILSEAEVVEIAENLTGAMESILRFKWRQKYENVAR